MACGHLLSNMLNYTDIYMIVQRSLARLKHTYVHLSEIHARILSNFLFTEPMKNRNQGLISNNQIEFSPPQLPIDSATTSSSQVKISLDYESGLPRHASELTPAIERAHCGAT